MVANVAAPMKKIKEDGPNMPQARKYCFVLAFDRWRLSLNLKLETAVIVL